MSPRLKSSLAVGASIALAVGLLYLSLREADFGAVAAALRDASWGWLVPMAVLSFLSVAIRAWRWHLLLGALPADGARPTLGLTLGATFIGYLVNYAAPRAGEVARAANVSARSGLSFPAVVGTVVAERVLDVVSLAVALVLVVALYGDRVAFITEGLGQAVAAALAGLSVTVVVVGALALAALVAVAVRIARRQARGPQTGGPQTGGRFAGLLAGFRDGLGAVARTRRPVALVGSTVLLWATYAVMADLPFRLLGLSATYGLSLVDAFAVMAVGAVGMALPSPGGAGSYHYATVQALTQLFGVGASDAATYALLAHAAQLVFYAVAGVLALVAQGTTLRSVRTAAAPADAAP